MKFHYIFVNISLYLKITQTYVKKEKEKENISFLFNKSPNSFNRKF